MFRIVKIHGGFRVEVETYTKVWWFFGKVEWLPIEFTHPDLPNGLTYPEYHQALQALLIEIEFRLNMKYLES